MAPTTTEPPRSPSLHPALHELAEQLTSHGLSVQIPPPDRSERLIVTAGSGAGCDVTLDSGPGESWAFITYFDLDAWQGQPGRVTAAIARMLGAPGAGPGQYASLHRGVTLAEAAGGEMEARGMDVTLSTAGNHNSYHVSVDLVIANPEKSERGDVHISDDSGGCLYWDSLGTAPDVAATLAAVLTA